MVFKKRVAWEESEADFWSIEELYHREKEIVMNKNKFTCNTSPYIEIQMKCLKVGEKNKNRGGLTMKTISIALAVMVMTITVSLSGFAAQETVVPGKLSIAEATKACKEEGKVGKELTKCVESKTQVEKKDEGKK